MADPVPSGLLSLTYHLAYDKPSRELWMNGSFAAVFKTFGITDTAVQKKILDINQNLGTPDDAERNALVDQWMAMLGNDIKTGAANPKVLW